MSGKGKSSTAVRKARASASPGRAGMSGMGGPLAILVLLVFAGVVGAYVVAQSGQGSAAAEPVSQPVPNSYGRAGVPPWPLPENPEAGAEAAGLDVAPMSGVAQHFHSHLDIFVNGKRVPVPASIGIGDSGMSALHTHDAGGVLHVEAPTEGGTFILGQLFNEWNVRLTDSSLGGLQAGQGNQLVAYVNGKKFSGNPAAIELKPKREIALVYGPNPNNVDVPAGYDFSSLGG